jgi:hypothetical protein
MLWEEEIAVVGDFNCHALGQPLVTVVKIAESSESTSRSFMIYLCLARAIRLRESVNQSCVEPLDVSQDLPAVFVSRRQQPGAIPQDIYQLLCTPCYLGWIGFSVAPKCDHTSR